jgi:hypothetical protein
MPFHRSGILSVIPGEPTDRRSAPSDDRLRETRNPEFARLQKATGRAANTGKEIVSAPRLLAMMRTLGSGSRRLRRLGRNDGRTFLVMPALVAGIHVFFIAVNETWMAGKARS